MSKITQVTSEILNEIKQALIGKEYGSVEIYIESGQVVQITERTIKKTKPPERPPKNISLRARAYTSTVKR